MKLLRLRRRGPRRARRRLGSGHWLRCRRRARCRSRGGRRQRRSLLRGRGARDRRGRPAKQDYAGKGFGTHYFLLRPTGQGRASRSSAQEPARGGQLVPKLRRLAGDRARAGTKRLLVPRRRAPVAVRVRRFARVYRNWAPASAGEPAVEMLDFACLNQRARPRGPLFEPSNRRGMTPGPSNKRRDFSGDKVTNDADVRDLIGRSQQPGVRSTLSPLAPGGAVSDRPAPRRPSPLPPARRESRRKGHAARRCGFRWHCLRGRSSRPGSGSSWSA